MKHRQGLAGTQQQSIGKSPSSDAIGHLATLTRAKKRQKLQLAKHPHGRARAIVRGAQMQNLQV